MIKVSDYLISDKAFFVHFHASKSTKLMNLLCQMTQSEFVSFNKPTVFWKIPKMKRTTIFCFPRNLVQQCFEMLKCHLLICKAVVTTVKVVCCLKYFFINQIANIYNKAYINSKDFKLVKIWHPDQFRAIKRDYKFNIEI